ncbi:tannase and feruloyl esterase [Mycena pura]|uniref:Carboxylic ester hydrolase n=1 Tax=Mycena pura TaxID=153505 RepID=A0AAD6V0H9_9AGAR|nr:tannase and feruloyl esterase [Mycena pura]
MEFAVAILSKLLFASGFVGPNWTTNYGGDATLRANCLALTSSLSIENTTILDASYLPAPSTIRTSGTCRSTATHTAPLCRVRFHTNTSATSGIDAEAWLPDEWYGRFMGIGNQGMQGCILYDDLDHGSALHFATVGSNNGHDGDTALPFFHNPDVLYDFSVRAIHAEAVVGKQIVEAYYGRPPAYSYYTGCSTGGRQGTQAALKHPDDFDGILAGSPAIDFNHLVHWTGMVSRHLGAPAAASPSFIPLESWKIIAKEVLRQCDALDGVADGVITDPDSCVFRPESLLCSGEDSSRRSCFTAPQVEALRKIYSPLYGPAGELLYSRFDPGAESSPLIWFLLSGKFPPYTEQWLKYVVLNVTDYNIGDYGAKHGALFDSVNGGDIATFNGDFSAFRDRGGKFLSYHGRADPACPSINYIPVQVIPSGNSKRLYDLISRTLSMPTLDTFYRLFLVPGMDHCTGGAGAFKFGQAPGTHAVNSSSHDIILALVDWVENNVAPDTIIGTASDGATRVHCRYPIQSRWNGSAFRCEAS